MDYVAGYSNSLPSMPRRYHLSAHFEKSEMSARDRFVYPEDTDHHSNYERDHGIHDPQNAFLVFIQAFIYSSATFHSITDTRRDRN